MNVVSLKQHILLFVYVNIHINDSLHLTNYFLTFYPYFIFVSLSFLSFFFLACSFCSFALLSGSFHSLHFCFFFISVLFSSKTCARTYTRPSKLYTGTNCRASPRHPLAAGPSHRYLLPIDRILTTTKRAVSPKEDNVSKLLTNSSV